MLPTSFGVHSGVRGSANQPNMRLRSLSDQRFASVARSDLLFKRVANIVVDFWKLCTLALVLIIAAGCDLTGQYDKKFLQALDEAKRRSAFDDQLHAMFTDVVDASRQPVGVKLRLPKKFDNESKAFA